MVSHELLGFFAASSDARSMAFHSMWLSFTPNGQTLKELRGV